VSERLPQAQIARQLRVSRNTEASPEDLYGVEVALDLDAQSGRGVGNRTGESELGGRDVDEGTEANPLHEAADLEPAAGSGGGRT